MSNLQMKDIWSQYKSSFSTKAQSDLEKMVFHTIIEYNESTDIIRPPHDPYPDFDIYPGAKIELLKRLKWPEAKVDLYRTVCKLGLECSYYRRLGIVKYFGCVIERNRNEQDVVDELVKIIEPYAKHNYIMGSLCKLSKIDIMDRYNSNYGSRAIITMYVALNEPGLYYLNYNPTVMEFQEGGTPYELP